MTGVKKIPFKPIAYDPSNLKHVKLRQCIIADYNAALNHDLDVYMDRTFHRIGADWAFDPKYDNFDPRTVGPKEWKQDTKSQDYQAWEKQLVQEIDEAVEMNIMFNGLDELGKIASECVVA